MKIEYIFLAFWLSIIIVFIFLSLMAIARLLEPLETKKVFSNNKAKSFIFKTLIFLRKKKGWLAGVLILFPIASCGLILLRPPKIAWPIYPAFGTKIIDESHPIEFVFDRPVNVKMIKIVVKPDVEGVVKNIREFKLNKLDDKFAFYPNTTLPPDTEFSVTVSSIRGFAGLSKGKEYLFNFHTPPPAQVTSVTPKNNSENVDINELMKVNVDYDDRFRTEWDFQFIPDVKYKIIENTGKSISIKPENALQKGTTYLMKISRTPIAYSFKKHKILSRGESEEVQTIAFKTVLSPTIKTSSPSGNGILDNASISVEFRQPMHTSSVEKAWSINPSVDGSFNWDGDTKLSFKPNKPLNKNTHYTVTISKSASTKFATTFDNDYQFGFTTIGPATASFSPGNNASGVSINKAISATFNQEVDHASAENSFSITPSIGGAFSWQGNSMTFKPSGNYQYGTSYTTSLNKGIKSIRGLDSNQIFSTKFTTASQVVKLNIPFYKQEHYYTCGIAAMRMALAYKGVKISEMDLLNKVGYDSTPLDTKNNIWGNPNTGFVGTLMGSPKGTGYGVHWGPVAKAASSFRTVEVKQGWTVQGIASEINNGNPVVIWWVNGVWPSFERSWKTPDGTTVRAVNAMHAVVVNGFTGSVDNPKSFTINDPWWPRKAYDIGLFKSYWHWFGNTAIVVH